MTQTETFTHDPDPPPIKHEWTDELRERVFSMWRYTSARQIADALTSELGYQINRNQIIGLVHRAGLAGDKPKPEAVKRSPRPRPKRNPILRFVAANGNSKSVRIYHSVTGEVGEMACAAVEPLNISLMELTQDTCRFPYGDSPFTFCGHQIQSGSSFCPAHHALCFTPPRERWV